MTQPVFKFTPGQDVMITIYKLDYQGRVTRCMWSRDGVYYDVDYPVDGKIESKFFYEDELEAR